MLKALNARVLVKIEEAKEQKVGGIILPSLAVSEDMGEVVSVGRDTDIIFQVGDKVLLPHYGCNQFIEQGTKYCVLYGSDILGVIK